MLVGRTTEQRRIEQVLDSARSGRAAVLALVGEPGVGKSALLEHAAARADGMTLLAARGVASETHVPFAGLLELLRPVLHRLERLPEPQARALESALALRPASAHDRFAVGAATLGLLSAVAEDAPLLVVVDDVHNLDDASSGALLFAARRLLADAVAVLLAARTGEPSALDGAGLPSLAVDGIDRAAAQDLLGGHRSLSGQVVERLHRETGGNPLAMLELVAEPAALQDDLPAGAPLPVVPAVAQAYRRRVAALPEATRLALVLAAVAGSVSLAVLASAGRALGVALDDLAPAEAAGLVSFETDRVVFRHPLVRAAVHGDAAAADRRQAHRALAAALPDADTDRRAWHRALAAVGPDDAACAAMQQAGDRARARSAYDAASRAYARAAVLAVDPSRRAGLQHAAAENAWLAGRAARALELLDGLGSATADVDVAAHHLRGHIATRQGPVAAGRAMLVEAADRTADPEQAVVVLAEALNAAFSAGDAASMRRLAERTAALAPPGAGPRTQFFATMAQGMARLVSDEAEQGAELVREAVAVVERVPGLADDPQVLAWLVMGPIWLREAGAQERVEAVLETSRRDLAIGVLPFLLSHVALGQAAADRWAEAAAGFQEAIGLARETGQRTDLAFALARLAWLEARQGRQQPARRHASEALALSRSIGLGPCEVWAHAALTDLELGRGRPEAALAHAEEQRAALTRLGIQDADLDPGPELVEAHLRLRQPDRAAHTAAAYLEAATAKGRPWALARAHRACGTVCAEDDAEPLFQQALSLHVQTPDAFETARTRLAYGARLRRSGRRADARDQLRSAVDELDRLGAQPWADTARAELSATGERARRRDPSTAQDLTPQELNIAVLLADGRTTREAAAAVFLSPKTVEYHLRSVYRKLQINSRGQLAEALGRTAPAERASSPHH